jgi:hypothetical protein
MENGEWRMENGKGKCSNEFSEADESRFDPSVKILFCFQDAHDHRFGKTAAVFEHNFIFILKFVTDRSHEMKYPRRGSLIVLCGQFTVIFFQWLEFEMSTNHAIKIEQGRWKMEDGKKGFGG